MWTHASTLTLHHMHIPIYSSFNQVPHHHHNRRRWRRLQLGGWLCWLVVAIHVQKVVTTQRLRQRRNYRSVALGIVVQLEQRCSHQFVVLWHREQGCKNKRGAEKGRKVGNRRRERATQIEIVSNVCYLRCRCWILAKSFYDMNFAHKQSPIHFVRLNDLLEVETK